jgi:hypothetical protein
MVTLYQLVPFSRYKVRHPHMGENGFRFYLNRLDRISMLCHGCGRCIKGMRNKQRRQKGELRVLEKWTFVALTQCQGWCPTSHKIR